MERGESIDLRIAGLGPAEMIGEGGNALVYRSRQDALDREVAVKVLKRSSDDGTQRRFGREQRAMGRMSQHDGIVTVYESGINGAGEPYLVMPLLPRSLQDELDSRGRLPWDEAIDLISDVATTVHFAHQNGLVHRDLKPANLMRSLTGRPLVADFGISQIVDSDASLQSTALTLTPAYSPPESMSGAEPAPTTDVYSLGATLYALIEGHPPFVDSTTSSNLLTLVRRVAEEPLPSLTAGAPPWVDAVLADAMTKEPAVRIQTAGELATRLRSGAPGLAATGIRAVDESAASNGATHIVRRPSDDDAAPSDNARHNQWILYSVAALIVVAVLAAVVVVAQRSPDQSADPVADTSVESTEPVASAADPAPPAADPAPPAADPAPPAVEPGSPLDGTEATGGEADTSNIAGSPASGERTYGLYERISFPAGTNQTIVSAETDPVFGLTSTVSGYLIGASAGQTMDILLISPNAVWELYAPDGSFLDSGVGVDTQTQIGQVVAPLPSSGDYLLVVSSTAGNAEYELDLLIL